MKRKPKWAWFNSMSSASVQKCMFTQCCAFPNSTRPKLAMSHSSKDGQTHRMVWAWVNPAGQEKWLFLHIQHSWACTGSAVSSFRLPGEWQMLTYRCKSTGGPWRWQGGGWRTLCWGWGVKRRESWVCSALRGDG